MRYIVSRSSYLFPLASRQDLVKPECGRFLHSVAEYTHKVYRREIVDPEQAGGFLVQEERSQKDVSGRLLEVGVLF